MSHIHFAAAACRTGLFGRCGSGTATAQAGSPAPPRAVGDPDARG